MNDSTRLMRSRRAFLRDLGLSAAALPFLSGLPSLRAATLPGMGKQRLVIIFSPNGTLPTEFWPVPPKVGTLPSDVLGPRLPTPPAPKELSGDDFTFNSILEPLTPWKDRTLMLKGLCNRVRGDGDGHMRGMSCLLTGDVLLPGNIQGGSHTPAGWASHRSIDQELRNFLQANDKTRTRFGSLEFGVAVPDRADPWTRMCYADSNKPVAPIDDPEQMFAKLYGSNKDRQALGSILDDVASDLKKISSKLSPEDRRFLDEHLTLVRGLEKDIQLSSKEEQLVHPEPEIDPDIELINDNTPELSRMQMDLLVNALSNDMTRVATLQFMRSVGQARMRWLDIQDGHHSLSHEPDANKAAQDKLLRINKWFAGEIAYLVKRLADTPEPGAEGSMLDHTTVMWVNELGKGNSHTLDNLPIVLIGGGLGYKTDRYLDLGPTPHNRLWLSVAKSFGHELEVFGQSEFCSDGALNLL